jgi:hypothetical protein
MSRSEFEGHWLDNQAIRDNLGELVFRPVGGVHEEYRALRDLTVRRGVSNGGVDPESESGKYFRRMVAVSVESEDRIQDIVTSLVMRCVETEI